VTETGLVVNSVPDELNLLWPAINAVLNEPEYVYLSSVDPYGDTIFNRRQVDRLVDELGRLCDAVHSSETESFIRRVISLAESARGQTGRYVKFIGD
jgi:hypothetical protein